ncbi:inositol monophosphatase family protein [Mycolicibacterium sp. 018/SC-01/001]|uniref:inositol monophosphatase family protein n=1 Tax=Mycolicibacterium sp. 018/SC-01/001 TaxID=2592069 RepID=UPI00351A7FD2
MSEIDTEPLAVARVAQQLAAEAAAFVRRRRAEVFDDGSQADADAAIRSKSTPTDPVTVVDTETERLLRERLAQLRPDEPILGEEEGGPDGGDDDERLTWVLDPIDGTVNFVYGIEAFAVSIGVQRGGVSIAGAVADVAHGVVYAAAAGHGAWMVGDGASTRLRCSAASSLPMALVGTGFSYQPDDRRRQGAVVAQLLPEIRDLRRIGSCALDLCMVAAGRLDAYFEDGVHVWDWAAGGLIAAEAGAVVRAPGSAGAGLMVAAAPGVATAFDDVLRRCGVDLGIDRDGVGER